MLCFSIDTCNFLIHQIKCSISIYIGMRLNITMGIQEDNQLQQKGPVRDKIADTQGHPKEKSKMMNY